MNKTNFLEKFTIFYYLLFVVDSIDRVISRKVTEKGKKSYIYLDEAIERYETNHKRNL